MEIFIKPENMIDSDVKAFFTTKTLKGDLKRLSEALNTSKNIYMPIQKHTDKVHILRDIAKPEIADAVITNNKGILVGVAVADCTSILLYDPQNEVIAAVHAGWRGTAQGILKRTVRTMVNFFYTRPESLYMAIGPSIKGCCYEIASDVLKAVKNEAGPPVMEDYFWHKQGRLYLDLPQANKTQALSIGIKPQNTWLSDECTFCNPDKFYSYRYSKGSTGRQGGFIGMW